MRKRVVISTVCAVIFMIVLVIRLGVIAFSGSYAVSDTYHSFSLPVDTVQPNLYYSNSEKINNNYITYYAVLKPNEATFAALPSLFRDSDEVIEELKKGKPLLHKVDVSYLNHIRVLAAYENKNTCAQLINRDSSGLLQYLPISVGSRKIAFYTDARGRMLSGDDGRLVDDHYDTREGLQLTLDKSVQQIAYDACLRMKSGCAVVMRVSDSAILAVVNRPEDTYINKAFSLYSVGSVFKTVCASAAINEGIDPVFNCSGGIRVGNVSFSCQKQKAHGKQHLKEALANSCNCYFVHLALELGADNLLHTAQLFGFSEKTCLYGDWRISNASLPTSADLRSKGQLALFGFGQGKLLATPLQICSVMCTLGNGGVYHSPYLVTDTVDAVGNRTTYNNMENTHTVTDGNTLIGYLRYTVASGTAKSADYRKRSAGKTATAQTGQFRGGSEVLNTWFAGLYPADNPQYAIVIMTENGTSGAADCCPIFRTMVEKLDSLCYNDKKDN